MTHDVINSPSHYAEGRKYEPIAVIEDWELGYHLGNALKYISRAGRKDATTQDLRKAVWYLNREIERLDGEEVQEEAAQTFLAENLYEEICLSDACGTLWDPALGPIEPPEDCVYAAQPVDLYGAAGQDTLDFSLLREDVVPNVEETEVGFRALYEDPFH